MCFPALEFTILPSAFKEYSAILLWWIDTYSKKIV